MICLEDSSINDIERRALELFFFNEFTLMYIPFYMRPRGLLSKADIHIRSQGLLSREDIDELAENARTSTDGFTKVRKISTLIPKVSYAENNSRFQCRSCHTILPHRFPRNKNANTICDECELKAKESELSIAQKELNELDSSIKVITPTPDDYLENLTLIELLYLKILINNNHPENGRIKLDRDLLETISGIESTDKIVFESLIKKGAIHEIAYSDDIESKVMNAISLKIEITHIKKRAQGTPTSKLEDHNSVIALLENKETGITNPTQKAGLYLNSPDTKIQHNSDLDSEIDYLIETYRVSKRESVKIKSTILDIQTAKVIALIEHAASVFRFRVAHTKPFMALAQYLARKYPLEVCYYTIKYKAQQFAGYLRATNPPAFKEQHMFTKSLTRSIEYMEENEYDISRTQKLPEGFSEPPLEILFASVLMPNSLSWRKLNAVEVYQQWLKDANLEEENAI